jgi:hypothetical protein
VTPKILTESEVFGISEKVLARDRKAHMWACENDADGPCYKSNKRIDEMGKRLDAVEQVQVKTEERRRGFGRTMATVVVLSGALSAGAAWFGALQGKAQPAPALDSSTTTAVLRELRALKDELRSAGGPKTP